MSRYSKILLLVALACMNLALLAYIKFWKATASVALPSLRKEPQGLPVSELVDDAGRHFRLEALTGRILLVQFVNPAVASQVDSVSKVVGMFGADEVSFVLVSKDARGLRALLPPLPDNVRAVEQHYAGLKDAFNVPTCCERRFIFNRSGELKYKDYYYETDLRPRLRSLTDATLQDYPEALAEALKSVSAGWLPSLRAQTRGDRVGGVLLILFESVNTSCPSRDLVREANRFSSAHRDVPLIAVLPGEYTPDEADNLKTNLQVRFSVERADPALTEKWAPLVGIYGEGRVNGSIVLIARGEVQTLNDLGEAEQALSRMRE